MSYITTLNDVYRLAQNNTTGVEWDTWVRNVPLTLRTVDREGQSFIEAQIGDRESYIISDPTYETLERFRETVYRVCSREYYMGGYA